MELRERTRVKEVGRGALKFADGEEVPANVVVWAAGFAVPDLARRSGLATDGRGRVLVDASLRSVSHPNVFAAGDSAWPVEPVGAGPVRPSAYTATIIGAHAGGNVARELAGKPTKPLSFGYAIQSISLGRGDGLAQFTDGYDGPFAWVVTGRLAARIKDAVERFAVVGPCGSSASCPESSSSPGDRCPGLVADPWRTPQGTHETQTDGRSRG